MLGAIWPVADADRSWRDDRNWDERTSSWNKQKARKKQLQTGTYSILEQARFEPTTVRFRAVSYFFLRHFIKSTRNKISRQYFDATVLSFWVSCLYWYNNRARNYNDLTVSEAIEKMQELEPWFSTQRFKEIFYLVLLPSFLIWLDLLQYLNIRSQDLLTEPT